MQFRIGERDPVTGFYYVIWPDGSQMLNGVKIFNSAYKVGDVVLATRRSDGMMILDSTKANELESPVDYFNAGLLDRKPVGYLYGQVFNDEEEVKPTVSIEFAPGSSTALSPGTGNFIVRIKVNRTQNRDLRVKCGLTGTAISGNYTYTGLDSDSIAIVPAGELFFDVTITPIQNLSGSNLDIVLTALVDSKYIVGQSDRVTAIILSVALSLSIDFAPGSPTQTKKGQSPFTVRISVNEVQPQDLYVFFTLTGTARYGREFGTNASNIATIVPSGQSYVDLVISPIIYEPYDSNRTTIIIALRQAFLSYTQYAFDSNTLSMTILPRQFVTKFYRRYTSASFSIVPVPPGNFLLNQPANLIKTPGTWTVDTISVDEGLTDRADYDANWLIYAVDPYNNLDSYIAFFNNNGGGVGIDFAFNGRFFQLPNSNTKPPSAPPPIEGQFILDTPGSTVTTYQRSLPPNDSDYYAVSKYWLFQFATYPGDYNRLLARSVVYNPSNRIYDAYREFEYV